MPDTSAPRPVASANIQPTTTDKLVGAATFAATNGATLVAPMLPMPGALNQDLGGITVNSFALFINAIIQQLKKHDWFEQDRIAIWTALVIAGYLCVAVWIWTNPSAALINFTNVVGLVLTNYGSMSKTGVIPTSSVNVTPAIDAVPQVDTVASVAMAPDAPLDTTAKG